MVKGDWHLQEIDKRQLYHDLAIRCMVGDVNMMKRDIKAIIRHCLSTDENPNRSMCPTGPTASTTGTQQIMYTKILCQKQWLHITPVFDRFIDSERLKHCVDGFHRVQQKVLTIF